MSPAPRSEEVKLLSRVRLFATPWTVQALPSMEFSRQEYWSGLPFPSPGDLPDRGIEPGFSTLQADALLSESSGNPNSFTEVLPFSTTPWQPFSRSSYWQWQMWFSSHIFVFSIMSYEENHTPCSSCLFVCLFNKMHLTPFCCFLNQ